MDNKNIKLIVSKNITELRKISGITQAELAERLNYSDKAVSKWERGESLPDIIVLKEIADMFEVTVDYLLHEHKEKTIPDKGRRKRLNRIIIILLSCALVWFVATSAFVGSGIIQGVAKQWIVFVYAIPVTCVVLLIYNFLWGNKLYGFFILTILVWSIITSFYLAFLSKNLWLLFILGIPAQVIVILWSGLKIRRVQ